MLLFQIWEILRRRKKKPTEPDGRFIRQERDEGKGLLIIYPIEATKDNSRQMSDGTGKTPLVGCVLSFPSVRDTVSASHISYVCDNVYYANEQRMLD